MRTKPQKGVPAGSAGARVREPGRWGRGRGVGATASRRREMTSKPEAMAGRQRRTADVTPPPVQREPLTGSPRRTNRSGAGLGADLDGVLSSRGSGRWTGSATPAGGPGRASRVGSVAMAPLLCDRDSASTGAVRSPRTVGDSRCDGSPPRLFTAPKAVAATSAMIAAARNRPAAGTLHRREIAWKPGPSLPACGTRRRGPALDRDAGVSRAAASSSAERHLCRGSLDRQPSIASMSVAGTSGLDCRSDGSASRFLLASSDERSAPVHGCCPVSIATATRPRL
jgi:hypothetical protein